MRRGLFTPAEPVGERDRRGSQVSLSDMVTLGLLHVLFGLGCKFQNIEAAEGYSDSVEIGALTTNGPGRTYGGLYFNVMKLPTLAAITVLTEINKYEKGGGGRPIQRFLELTDFGCSVCLASFQHAVFSTYAVVFEPKNQHLLWRAQLHFKPIAQTAIHIGWIKRLIEKQLKSH
ncbi:MAG: hypothetical protein ACOYXY_21925 [Thermodesulfobacteriota bacterium]